MGTTTAVAATLALIATGAYAALPIIDDFEDGDDAGWTRFEPLAGFGSPGTFSFPSGGYRIQATVPSPNPGLLGATRVGSLRTDETLSDTVVAWDLVDWNDGLDQVFGGLARIAEVGLGTTDGYGLVYGGGALDLLRFDDEAVGGAVAPTVSITLNPANDYRFVFTLSGSTLTGQVFDLSAPTTVLATISGTDSTYASGVTGLLVADASGTGTGTADATFDNFSANVPEPSAVALALLGVGALFRRRR